METWTVFKTLLTCTFHEIVVTSKVPSFHQKLNGTLPTDSGFVGVRSVGPVGISWNQGNSKLFCHRLKLPPASGAWIPRHGRDSKWRPGAVGKVEMLTFQLVKRDAWKKLRSPWLNLLSSKKRPGGHKLHSLKLSLKKWWWPGDVLGRPNFQGWTVSWLLGRNFLKMKRRVQTRSTNLWGDFGVPRIGGRQGLECENRQGSCWVSPFRSNSRVFRMGPLSKEKQRSTTQVNCLNQR